MYVQKHRCSTGGVAFCFAFMVQIVSVRFHTGSNVYVPTQYFDDCILTTLYTPNIITVIISII